MSSSSCIWSFLWDGNCNISYYIPRDTLCFLYLAGALLGKKGFLLYHHQYVCIVVELRTRRETMAWCLANADWTVLSYSYLFMIIYLRLRPFAS